MCTSDEKKFLYRHALIYCILTLFCAAFGGIYEHFSYGVYSNNMIYAFAFPLAGGLLPLILIIFTEKFRLNRTIRTFIYLYDSGIALFTVGSILKGVLDIYGTTNHLIKYYNILGTVFLAVGLIGYLYSYKRSYHVCAEKGEGLPYRQE